jgi:hypothetical protein
LQRRRKDWRHGERESLLYALDVLFNDRSPCSHCATKSRLLALVRRSVSDPAREIRSTCCVVESGSRAVTGQMMLMSVASSEPQSDREVSSAARLLSYLEYVFRSSFHSQTLVNSQPPRSPTVEYRFQCDLWLARATSMDTAVVRRIIVMYFSAWDKATVEEREGPFSFTERLSMMY